MPEKPTAVPTVHIEKRIYFIRDHKVMLDSDLAELYGVQAKRLNEAVKHNRARFPEDFMFQLMQEEVRNMGLQVGLRFPGVTENLRSKISTSSWGGRRYMPYVFTEQGVAMLSSVLRSKRAVRVNIEIMRAFVRLRRILATHKDLARKLNELESKYDAQFKVVFDAIRRLMTQTERPAESKPVGFRK